jgi:hypothetical protein
VAKAAELMQVAEEASVTVEEPGVENVPLYHDDQITPKLDPETNEQLYEKRKVTVRTPVALHKGVPFPATHEYVKKWPHLFEPFRVKAEA